MKKSTKSVASFIAGDLTIIKELLSPTNDGVGINYSLAHATVEVGRESIPHILHKSSELYYILKGVGEAFIEQKSYILEKGDYLLIPAGANQYIKNIGNEDLDFLCIVSPPWTIEQEEVF